MSTPQDVLGHFNLTPQEAEIYVATLALGKASVNDIAKKVGKSRTSTYFQVDHLLQKGMLKETRQGKSVRLVATPPAEVVSMVDRWSMELKSFVPLLESIRQAEAESPIIEILESKRGYFKMFDEVASLPIGSTFRVLEGAEAVSMELGLLTQDQWSIFLRRMIDRRIETKAIFTQSALALPRRSMTKKNLELLRQRIWHLRAISDAMFPFQKLLVIYGEKVTFLFPELALVVSIQHKGICEILRLMFDGMYHQGTRTESGW